MSERGAGHEVQVVSFDLWYTLIGNGAAPPEKSRYTAIQQLLGLESIDRDEFAATSRRLELRADEICETTDDHLGPFERTALIADHYRVPMVSVSQFHDFYRAMTAVMLNYPPSLMHPGILDTLRALGARYQLTVTSNTGFFNGAEMRLALQAIGIWPFISHAIFSDEVGRNKPHRQMFDEVVRRTNVPHANVLHVGDNARADFEGARQAGMQAVHLKPGMTIEEAMAPVLHV